MMVGARLGRSLLALALVLSLAVVFPGGNAGALATFSDNVNSSFDRAPFQGRYIVILDTDRGRAPGIIQALRQEEGFSTDFVYENVFLGFSARLNSQQAQRLARRGVVQAVIPDVEVTVAQQTIPPGISAIGVLDNQTANVNGVDNPVDIDIAIVDTGILGTHPDLRVVGGYNCMSTSRNAWTDGHGHGTHVAGTAAAIDNTRDVVGVAPGARLWAVRVLDNNGSGSLSTVICGLDWIATQATTIDVVNMSLGSQLEVGSVDPMRASVQTLVNTHGIPVVVSAGNGGVRADQYETQVCVLTWIFGCRRWETRTMYQAPAAYPETIAVGAMNVSNNTRASFSNFGPAVQIFAPGVSVLSTHLNNGTATFNGTSMASPHVAGAVGLYLAVNAGASPSQVLNALVQHGINHGAYDSYNQPMVHVAGFAPPGPNFDLEVTSVNAPGSMFTGDSANVTVAVQNTGNETLNGVNVRLEANGSQVGSTQTINLGVGQSQNVTFNNWSPSSSGTVTLEGIAEFDNGSNQASDSATATVSVQDKTFTLDVTALGVPSTVFVGSATNVSVTVQNTGNQTLSNVTVVLEADSTQVGASQQIASLAPGASQSRTFSWTPAEAKTYQLTGSASSNDAALAQRSQSVQAVETTQSVVVTNVSANPATITQGGSTTIQVSVRNDSTQAETISVSLGTNPGTGFQIPSSQQQNIAGNGGTRTFTFQLASNVNASPVAYTVTATGAISGGPSASNTTTVTVNAAPSVIPMHVHALTGSFGIVNRSQVISGQATIRDSSNQPVNGAEVRLTLTGPGISSTAILTTNSNGVVNYSFSGLFRRGTYTVTVQDVTRNGYEYTPANNNVTSIGVNV